MGALQLLRHTGTTGPCLGSGQPLASQCFLSRSPRGQDPVASWPAPRSAQPEPLPAWTLSMAPSFPSKVISRPHPATVASPALRTDRWHLSLWLLGLRGDGGRPVSGPQTALWVKGKWHLGPLRGWGQACPEDASHHTNRDATGPADQQRPQPSPRGVKPTARAGSPSGLRAVGTLRGQLPGGQQALVNADPASRSGATRSPGWPEFSKASLSSQPPGPTWWHELPWKGRGQGQEDRRSREFLLAGSTEPGFTLERSLWEERCRK